MDDGLTAQRWLSGCWRVLQSNDVKRSVLAERQSNVRTERLALLDYD